MFGTVDEGAWMGAIHLPVITPRGLVETGNLTTKAMVLKIENDNAHVYWLSPVCQGLS